MAQEEKGDSSSFNQDDLPGRCRYVHVKLAINTIKGNISEDFSEISRRTYSILTMILGNVGKHVIVNAKRELFPIFKTLIM
jgi:hypothetical protein